MIAVVVALPFARRGGWLGWLALVVMAGVAVLLWAAIAIGATRTFLAWRRDRPIEADDPRVGECYTNHGYKISWDHDSFSLRTCAGDPVVQVPLPELLDVIDGDALFLYEDITASTPKKHVSFPKSRSARFRIVQLIADLAGSCLEVQREIECRRAKYMRQFAIWLPASLLTAAILVLVPMLMVPDPMRLNLFWIAGGMAYGLAWMWVIRKFAYSVACFFGGRKLQTMLRQALTSKPAIRCAGAAKSGGFPMENQSSPPRDRGCSGPTPT
jgi:hypothetical protein